VTSLADPSILVFKQVVAVLGKLTADQLAELAEGRAQLVFRSEDTEVAAKATRARPAAKGKAKPDVDGAVAAIRELAGAEQIEAYLAEHDKALTTPVLREIAKRLGPTVISSGRTKADLKRNIIEGTAGFRERSAAMSGGAWR
jgi:hypothetical protein